MSNMYLGRKARVKARAARSDSDRGPENGGSSHPDEEMLVSAAQEADATPQVFVTLLITRSVVGSVWFGSACCVKSLQRVIVR